MTSGKITDQRQPTDRRSAQFRQNVNSVPKFLFIEHVKQEKHIPRATMRYVQFSCGGFVVVPCGVAAVRIYEILVFEE